MQPTSTPRSIAWEEFSKTELVELMREFERCGFTVGELWSNCDVHTVRDCTCAPVEESLPAKVLEIRERALIRNKPRRSPTPLANILSNFFTRSEKQQGPLSASKSRLG